MPLKLAESSAPVHMFMVATQANWLVGVVPARMRSGFPAPAYTTAPSGTNAVFVVSVRVNSEKPPAPKVVSGAPLGANFTTATMADVRAPEDPLTAWSNPTA